LVRAGSGAEKFEELGPVIEGRGTCLSVSARHLRLALCLSLCRSFSFFLFALVILHAPAVARVKRKEEEKTQTVKHKINMHGIEGNRYFAWMAKILPDVF
jgi:hypothetical protein